MLLVEAYNVIIRAEAIHTSFLGGYPSFILNLWNDTCTMDGELVRLGFMSYETMIAYGKALTKKGLQASRDFTLFDMVQGSLIPCPGIDWQRSEWFIDRSKNKFTMAWLRTEYGGVENPEVKEDPVMAYPDWGTPEKGIQADDFMQAAEMNSRYKLVKYESNDVLTFYDKLLERVVFSA